MGLYDRDYQRDGYYDDHQPGFHVGAPTTLTTKLVIVTCGVYVVQLLAGPWFTDAFALDSEWYRRPWLAYQLLTYGFLHAPDDLWHIALNMFVLWMFGRELEWKYGAREFLAFYLTAIVAASIFWTLAEIPVPGSHTMLGASGGVAAVLILFTFHFPHRTVLLMFVFPIPMWLLAALMVVGDLVGAISRSGTVAFTAHLGGAAFGYLYYRQRVRLERWLPGEAWLKRLRPKPKLRVHDPGGELPNTTDNRVDEILQKIQEHGQESLTRRERRILEQASREYQKRRR